MVVISCIKYNILENSKNRSLCKYSTSTVWKNKKFSHTWKIFRANGYNKINKPFSHCELWTHFEPLKYSTHLTLNWSHLNSIWYEQFDAKYEVVQLLLRNFFREIDYNSIKFHQKFVLNTLIVITCLGFHLQF